MMDVRGGGRLRVQFEAFVLDAGTRQLLRAGRPVHLTPKAFELLRVLLEHRPSVLSKAKLKERLWPRTHVQEANLPNLVKEVRTALGDSARSPRAVRTVHGIGYAFCGTATTLGPGSPGGERQFVYRLHWQEGVVALAEGDHVLGRHSDSVV